MNVPINHNLDSSLRLLKGALMMLEKFAYEHWNPGSAKQISQQPS